MISEHYIPKHEFVMCSQIFFFQHAAGSGGGGQQLMSSGSCLERFQSHPYLECGSQGTCHYYSDKYSFWLVAVETFYSPNQVLINSETLREKISRCNVCQLEV